MKLAFYTYSYIDLSGLDMVPVLETAAAAGLPPLTDEHPPGPPFKGGGLGWGTRDWTFRRPGGPTLTRL